MTFSLFIRSAIVALILYGCGGPDAETEIKNVIKSELKDPDSLKIKQIVFSKSRETACIEWNSKNSFGGYGNFSKSIVKNKGENKWDISSFDFDGDCSNLKYWD